MISVYIHIPFCHNICHYCDFCKLYKNDIWIDKYLDSLKDEIQQNYKGEKVKTLYIGGGTPSTLNLNQLKKLFKIVENFNISLNCEITIECNVEDLSVDKLAFLQKKVNRLSIGVQTFNNAILHKLGRLSIDVEKIKTAKKYFDNINIDLMYGLPMQTKEDFIKDIDIFLKLGVNHLSAYNLIIEPHTTFYIEKIKSNDDIVFEEILKNKLKNYNHYEISNYAKNGYESKHNLTYWDNEPYYGFGLGASGYIANIRYDNTRNLNKYLNGQYLLESKILDQNEILQNEFILGLRKINGLDKGKFYQKYNFDIKEINIVEKLLKEKKLLEDKTHIFINPKYLNLSNEILVNFLETIY